MGRLCGVIVQVLDCSFEVIEFKLPPFYYIHFRSNTPGKGMNSVIPAN